MSYNYAIFDTEFGWVAIVGSAAGLSRITLPQPDRDKARETMVDELKDIADLLLPQSENASFFGDLIPRLQRYFKGLGGSVNFPDALDLRDFTTFQGDVWALTRTIPYGETRTYRWVAKEISPPSAARAVGQALKRNRFPIVVPCHRVIGSDGSLVGFSNGLEMKQRLLALEAASKVSRLTLSNYHVIAKSAVSQSPERSEGDEAISNEGIASLPPQ